MLHKNIKKIKLLLCGLVSVLALSIVQFPAAYATDIDSCLVVTPYQENIWSDPDHSVAFYVAVLNKCDIKLYDLDVSFTSIDSVEGLIQLHYDNHDSLTNVEESRNELRMKWSGKEDEQEDVDYVEFNAPGGSWDDLFGYWYIVPMSSLNPPATFKRNMPVTINSAHYEVNGEMKEVKNLVLNTVLVKAPDYDKKVLMISGVEKQNVTYTGQPVVLEGELEVEENDDNITAEDLTEHYYVYDDSDLSFTPIDRPTEPGNFYLVEYNFENDNYRASLRVPFVINEYYTVNTQVVTGEGEISAPQYIDAGGSAHIDINPGNNYEVARVIYNGEDVTELLNDDNSLDLTDVNENVNVKVYFRPVYQVIKGHGTEHALNSNDDLAFMIDKDPYSYTDGEVTIMVDGKYIRLDDDAIVEPLTQTTTLLSSYLNTLEVGEHRFEMLFFDTDSFGIARATFVITEAAEEESEGSDSSDDSEESVPVPDTGASTTGVGSAEAANIMVIIGGAAIAMIVFFATKRLLKK